MPPEAGVERAVEVGWDRGAERDPRYAVGSGYLIGGPLVLTAAHNIGEGELWVRLVTGREYRARQLNVADGADVALLEIADRTFPAHLPLVAFADVDRTSEDQIERCSAVGFPRFKEKRLVTAGRPLRDTAHLWGVISPRANLVSGDLEFQVTATPRPLPSGDLWISEWQGISGAVVRAHHPRHASVVVGVIAEHHRPEGVSCLTVVPITAVTGGDGWRSQLGIADDSALSVLPYRPVVEPSPYWATVNELARRSPVLLDRMAELTNLGSSSAESGGYLWLVGDKWSGKTALTSHFALNLPPGVDGVTYFLVRNGDADSRRFVQVLNDQLARLLNEDPTAATGHVDAYRMRWERAVERAERERRRLLLVVEGIDDDASSRRDLPSVGSLLPRLVGEWAQVMVTSRLDASVPPDVDPGHPLYRAHYLRLTPPSDAVRVRTREIEARHRLCPVCKQRDEAESVPLIVRKGTSPGSRLPFVPFTLGGILDLPAPSDLRLLRNTAIVFTVLVVPVLFLWAVAASLGDNSGQGVFWLLLMGSGATYFWIAYSRTVRARERARPVWAALDYCHRDGVVFQPATGESFYPADLKMFLYRPRLLPAPPAPSQRLTN